MEKLHLSDDQMRTFFSDIFFGRPGEKVGVERTTRTEYVLVAIVPKWRYFNKDVRFLKGPLWHLYKWSFVKMAFL